MGTKNSPFRCLSEVLEQGIPPVGLQEIDPKKGLLVSLKCKQPQSIWLTKKDSQKNFRGPAFMLRAWLYIFKEMFT